MSVYLKTKTLNSEVEELATVPELTNATPEPLGTANPGTSNEAARADHVHPYPEDWLKSNLLDWAYPVGSVYITVSTADPATLFGGTWQKIEERFLLGASSSYALGSTGGAATHTITIDELPAHSHTGSTSSAGSHSHSVTTSTNGGHSHDRGSLRIVGSFWAHCAGYGSYNGTGPFYDGGTNLPWGVNRAGGGGYYGDEPRCMFDTNEGGFSGGTGWSGDHSHSYSTNSSGAHSHTIGTSNVGGSKAINIMPPYLAANIWKRVN